MKCLRFAVVFLLLFCFALSPAQAVSEWSRLYHMPCEGCHNAFPRMNATGMLFRRNGYRFSPGDLARIDARTLSSYIGPTWSPTLTATSGKSMIGAPNNVKIHIGGAVGRNAAFLVQPTPGGAADFNMAQGILTFSSARDSVRIVGGRLFAWGNGGGTGASDRYPTATLPRLFSEIHGVGAGGIGNGARVEYTHDNRTTLAAFVSDMAGTATKAGVGGLSFNRTLDRRGSSLEFFTAIASVPTQTGYRRAARYGVLFSHVVVDGKGRQPVNFLTGLMNGAENRAVKAGLPTHFWAGFSECDWTPNKRITWLLRGDLTQGVHARSIVTAFTVGAAYTLTHFVRIDADWELPNPEAPSARLEARLRFVY